MKSWLLKAPFANRISLFADTASFKVNHFLHDLRRGHLSACHLWRDDMRHDHATAKRFLRVHYSFSHFDQLGQVVAGVFGCPFSAMHGADSATTFT